MIAERRRERAMESVPWNPLHPVRQLMIDRRADGSRPGSRHDEYKLGLAVEGGGIRGVVSAAMLSALEKLGYADTFDSVYGCSSGAINLAYFLNRDTWLPLTIYFDDLTTGEFLDFSRLWRGRSPMDVDFVFNDVLAKRKPLNYDRVIDNPQTMNIMITDVDDLQARNIGAFEDVEDFKAALRASIWLPLATWGTTPFRGHRAIDGGIIRFHPYRAAVDDGCTHILSLSTRPTRPPKTKISATNRFTARRLEKMRTGLGTRFIDGVSEYQSVDRPLLNASRNNVDAAPSILDIAPIGGTPEVKRDEQDRRPLIDGAAAAYASMYEIFELRKVKAVVAFDVVDDHL